MNVYNTIQSLEVEGTDGTEVTAVVKESRFKIKSKAKEVKEVTGNFPLNDGSDSDADTNVDEEEEDWAAEMESYILTNEEQEKR